MIDPSQDAFGTALLDYLDGKEVPELLLEVKNGAAGPAMHPEWFFSGFDRWEWWDRELLPLIEHGPVLDLGAGAGRASLYLQGRGLRVTAVDASPAAAEVRRRRDVADVRLGDVNDPPADQSWHARCCYAATSAWMVPGRVTGACWAAWPSCPPRERC